jgi:hypothetical protein
VPSLVRPRPGYGARNGSAKSVGRLKVREGRLEVFIAWLERRTRRGRGYSGMRGRGYALLLLHRAGNGTAKPVGRLEIRKRRLEVFGLQRRARRRGGGGRTRCGSGFLLHGAGNGRAETVGGLQTPERALEVFRLHGTV